MVDTNDRVHFYSSQFTFLRRTHRRLQDDRNRVRVKSNYSNATGGVPHSKGIPLDFLTNWAIIWWKPENVVAFPRDPR